jgi:hypothetical protein
VAISSRSSGSVSAPSRPSSLPPIDSPTFYAWRVLLPMTLLVITSWAVFRFEPTNLQPQISTGLAILLSLVRFT